MIVVANESGQLGNRLFHFGHLIGFAEEHGVPVANPAFYRYSAYFQATSRDLLCRFPASVWSMSSPYALQRFCHRAISVYSTIIGRLNLLPSLQRVVSINYEEVCFLNRPGFVGMACQKKLVFVRGWKFRDYASFDKHADAIRAYFRPVPEIEQNVAELIRKCRAQAGLVIGVHIRQGDYRDHCGGIFFYAKAQYAAAMRGVESLCAGKSVLFLLCSNESLDLEAFAGLHVGFSTNHMVEDMYALALCDYILGPPSTFSHWASFYGRVPLYRMLTPEAPQSWEQFQVAGGNCDLEGDIESCTEVLPT